MSPEDWKPWESDADLPWQSSDQEMPKPYSEPWSIEDDSAWRGEAHLADWPEELAGPEYWLYKRQSDDTE